MAAAAAVLYLVNTALVTGAASLQMRLNPLRFWWMGTRENGPAELSLLAFGFLGALAYRESPWTLLALILPVAVVYVAFSRIARTNSQLSEAMRRLESLQGQIANSSKLASIGAISLDMAHQIKNPLTILLGRLENLQDRIPEQSVTRRDLDRAVTAGWRIQELTQNFTSIGNQEPIEIDVGDLLTDAFGMAGIRNHRRIQARWRCQTELPKVAGNPVLLREALTNIFFNAMEAVSQDGKITTDATRVNGTIVIRISNDGSGIPEDVMDHLFEPFYSTKDEGSGLGLFAANHIVEMHRGSVSVHSEEGRGTSVTVTLPAQVSEGQANRADGTDTLPPTSLK